MLLEPGAWVRHRFDGSRGVVIHEIVGIGPGQDCEGWYRIPVHWVYGTRTNRKSFVLPGHVKAINDRSTTKRE